MDLIKFFFRGSGVGDDPETRTSAGVFSGYVGIAINTLLFAVKITVGLLSGSVAVAADAVNNLSDAGSGVVTVIGFKMAAKPADREHPFGHGRIELCGGVVVAVIIMMMGLDFFKESVSRIITPGEVKMSSLMFILLACSLLFKLGLFFFYRRMGKLINSGTLIASAFDSLSDMACTAVVLLAVFVSKYTGFPVDGVAGSVVAAMVFAGGCKVLKDAISPLLGESPDSKLVKELQENLLKCEGITGVHDIIIHNYGPEQYFATAHAEVEMQSDLIVVHDMLERAEVEIGKTMSVNLLLHCDPYNPDDAEGKVWRVRFEAEVARIDPIFKVYDFRMKKSEEQVILSTHILVPRNYRLSFAALNDALGSAMKQYTPAPELHISFIHPFV